MYLTHVLGHVCYGCWTLTRMKQAFPSFGEAKVCKPAVLARRRLSTSRNRRTFWSACSMRTGGASGEWKAPCRCCKTSLARTRGWPPSNYSPRAPWLPGLDGGAVRESGQLQEHAARMCGQFVRTGRLVLRPAARVSLRPHAQ